MLDGLTSPSIGLWIVKFNNNSDLVHDFDFQLQNLISGF